MLSRIFWIGLTGIALIAGMAWQGGHRLISWDHDSDRSAKQIEARVDEAIDHGLDKMQVTGEGGDTIDVPPETKRALADAIGRLVKAETSLAVLRIGDGSKQEIDAATARRDKAKADVEALKEQVERKQALAENRRHDFGDEIRAEVRESVKDAVKN